MTLDEMAEALQQGDRRSLARAITLVESARADHRAQALALPAAGRLSAMSPAPPTQSAASAATAGPAAARRGKDSAARQAPGGGFR